MNYSEGIEYMIQLCEQFGSFSPYDGITINYPGYKKKGDYRLTINEGQAPTHSIICRHLYDLIENGDYSFNDLTQFLSDIYSNGTNTRYTDNNLEYLQNLIYWITLQEEINYPRSRGFAGINLAFCRFFEAIFCTQQLNDFNIQTVQMRCNNHGNNRPILYDLVNPPDFYHY